jgi:hypothetical protein
LHLPGQNALASARRASATPLLDALALLKGLADDTRKPLPEKVPESIIERSWRSRVFKDGRIDRQYYELGVYFGLATALRAGDVWVTGSKLHRSIEAYLLPPASTVLVPARLPAAPALTAARYLDDRVALLDRRLLEVGKKLASGQVRARRSIAIGCLCQSQKPKMIPRHAFLLVGSMG